MKVYEPTLIGTGTVTRSRRRGRRGALLLVAGVRLVEGDILTQPHVETVPLYRVLAAHYHQRSDAPDLTRVVVRAMPERESWADWLWHLLVGAPEAPIPKQGVSCLVQARVPTPSSRP